MPNNCLTFPKVCKRSDGKYYIDFKLNSKRYRLFSGRLIASSLYPNSYPEKKRMTLTTKLAKEVYEYVISNNYSLTKPVSKIKLFDKLIDSKLSEPLSDSYYKMLYQLSRLMRSELKSKGNISSTFIESIPLQYKNNTSYNTIRRHLNVLVNYLHNRGFPIELSKLKSRKQQEVLHCSINNIRELLLKIKNYNENLYVCCQLTYGCLLRPHHEIRNLKWMDFNEDLTYIKLSGKRVKSRRIRIVPVPEYIREVLVKRDLEFNIFSNAIEPYNKGYFSLLWRRFKRLNPDIGTGVTIYSFRHSGAIDIFKRTGSITKLQKAMGHSSINVSLTYLRGLEVPELKEEDMPMI